MVAVRDRLGVREDDVMVAWVPHWHDLGLIGMIIRSVHDGMPCHLIEPAIGTIPSWFQKIAEVRGTCTGAPDFALRLATRLIDPRRTDLSCLRIISNGGEPVRSKTMAAFEDHFGLSRVVTPAYGLAEATCGVSSPPPGGPLRADAHGHVSCGRPLDGIEVRPATVPRRPTRSSCAGKTVFAGYLDAPEATAEILRDGWLHTGDVGYRDADGFLYVLGRRRAMIKRGGATLAPRELEEAAMTVAGVRVAAAVGVASEASSTEEVVVAVEVKEPDEAGGRVSREATAAVQAAIGFGRAGAGPRAALDPDHGEREGPSRAPAGARGRGDVGLAMTVLEAATLPGLLRARVSTVPGELAYADADRRVSYAELDARTAAGSPPACRPVGSARGTMSRSSSTRASDSPRRSGGCSTSARCPAR